jgi:hypothetical protein
MLGLQQIVTEVQGPYTQVSVGATCDTVAFIHAKAVDGGRVQAVHGFQSHRVVVDLKHGAGRGGDVHSPLHLRIHRHSSVPSLKRNIRELRSPGVFMQNDGASGEVAALDAPETDILLAHTHEPSHVVG